MYEQRFHSSNVPQTPIFCNLKKKTQKLKCRQQKDFNRSLKRCTLLRECKRRQKEIKRCHNSAAESLRHPSPTHQATPQPIAAEPCCFSYPDAAENRRSATVKDFFSVFSTSIFRERGDAVTQRRACAGA